MRQKTDFCPLKDCMGKVCSQQNYAMLTKAPTRECNVLRMKFNIMAAIFPANPLLAHIFASIAPTCLGTKQGAYRGGWITAYLCLNIHSVRHTALFAAKYGVKCTKTQGKMHQNTLHLAPKRNAKCTKTQGKMHQNARQNVAKQQALCKNMQCEKGLKYPLDGLK